MGDSKRNSKNDNELDTKNEWRYYDEESEFGYHEPIYQPEDVIAMRKEEEKGNRINEKSETSTVADDSRKSGGKSDDVDKTEDSRPVKISKPKKENEIRERLDH